MSGGTTLMDGALVLHPPLKFAGATLGLSGTSVWFCDDSGRKYTTESVEWLLQNIDHFEQGRDRTQPLALAALHYGLDPSALMGRETLCDVRIPTGEMLLAGVTQDSAYWAVDVYMSRPEWGSDVHVRFRSTEAPPGDRRHEGPLVLIHHSFGFAAFSGATARSHVGRCGMTNEEVLRRIEQFSHADQATLLAGLAKHFDLGQEETAGVA